MDDSDISTYAQGAAAALRVIGPTARADVVGMLCGLHLTEEEASAVIAHGLARRILAEDDARLRALGEPLGTD
jgi:hypothetical protein